MNQQKKTLKTKEAVASVQDQDSDMPNNCLTDLQVSLEDAEQTAAGTQEGAFMGNIFSATPTAR